MYSKLIIF